MHISKNDAPRMENDARAPPSSDQQIKGFPWRRRKEGRRLHLDDAFKKEMVPKAPPAPALAINQEQVFTV
jgi:hypothetical protein